MEFELKSYKLQKTKSYFQKNSIFFIYNVPNLNSTNWVKAEQNFYKYDLKYYKIYNTLSKKFLEKSIFKNTNILINNSVCLVHFDKNANIQTDIKKLINLNPVMFFLGLRLNNKIYSLPQLTTVPSISYNKNIKIFNKVLTKLLKLPYLRLKGKNSK